MECEQKSMQELLAGYEVPPVEGDEEPTEPAAKLKCIRVWSFVRAPFV